MNFKATANAILKSKNPHVFLVFLFLFFGVPLALFGDNLCKYFGLALLFVGVFIGVFFCL